MGSMPFVPPWHSQPKYSNISKKWKTNQFTYVINCSNIRRNISLSTDRIRASFTDDVLRSFWVEYHLRDGHAEADPHGEGVPEGKEPHNTQDIALRYEENWKPVKEFWWMRLDYLDNFLKSVLTSKLRCNEEGNAKKIYRLLGLIEILIVRLQAWRKIFVGACMYITTRVVFLSACSLNRSIYFNKCGDFRFVLVVEVLPCG